MAVITISREFGSGGTEISLKVAKALSYSLIDKDSIERVLKQYGLIHYDELYQTSGFWARYDSSNIQMVKMLNQTILAFARRGNSVILGRGGFAILRDYGDALNVRIQAPFAERAHRVMKAENLPDFKAAEELVKENDRVRAGFISTFYNTRWDDAAAFSLVIDTSRVPADTAVGWITEAARRLDQVKLPPGLSIHDIEVDAVLARTLDDLQFA